MITPDFSSMNETDVRESIVRPLIERLGYLHGTEANIRTEQKLTYRKSFLGHKNPKKDPILRGRADYICELISFERWIVEVKAPSEQLTQEVVEQAHTYAAHPEVAASFFLVTNGQIFKLYQTAKLHAPVLQWTYENADSNYLKLFNILSPAAIRDRAKIAVVDPGKPLGSGLASHLKIIGGEVIYDSYTGNHPLFQVDSIIGLHLPVTGGTVRRDADNRIVAHINLAAVAPLMHELNEALGVADGYDFYSATEYISIDPDRPTIFQNLVKNIVPAGTIINFPGMGKSHMPFEISFASFTEAVGSVQNNRFAGTMRISSEVDVSKIPSQLKGLMSAKLGHFPEKVPMEGFGRFDVSLLNDL